MRRLAASRVIERPPEEVFDWVADYRHVPRVMEGVKEWRPLGVQAEGVGARYQVELDLLPVSLRARLVIVEWRRPEVIGWTAESAPVSNRGRWRFERRKAGTEVELSVTYEPPAGPVGNFLASGVEGIVRDRIVIALDRIKEELER